MPANIRKGRGGKGPRRASDDAQQRDQLVEQIVARYAVADDSGAVRRCGPRKDEDAHENWRWSGNDGKPVMKDRAAAEECARQLAVAKRQPQHAYRCPRSKSGHYHVAGGRAGKSDAYRQRRAT